MVWPIDDSFVKEWAKGLEKILVVEEKRGLIEGQVKEALYGTANSPQIIGKRDVNGDLLLPSNGVLDPINTNPDVEYGPYITEAAPCTSSIFATSISAKPVILPKLFP